MEKGITENTIRKRRRAIFNKINGIILAGAAEKDLLEPRNGKKPDKRN